MSMENGNRMPKLNVVTLEEHTVLCLTLFRTLLNIQL